MILETLRKCFSSDWQFISGDEYAGPCPWCGGRDRFRVWETTGKWWCRQCDKKGDEIQFLREFKGMTYQEACLYLGMEPKARERAHASLDRHQQWEPKAAASAQGDKWQSKAKAVIENASSLLWQLKPPIKWLHDERGLTDETIKAASLGWNSSDKWFERSEFGLDPAISQKTGKPKKVWLPAGLVIPMMEGGNVTRIRVRRKDPGAGDRYILISGSQTAPMVWPVKGKAQAIMIIESELDGLLVHQAAGDLVAVVAMGSAQAKPDLSLDRLIRAGGFILNSLDYDEAGSKAAWSFWAVHYQAKRWPCIRGKDPGEMFKAGVNIRAWVSAGLPVKEEGGGDPHRLREIIRMMETGKGLSPDRIQELSQEGDRLIQRMNPDVVNSVFNAA